MKKLLLQLLLLLMLPVVSIGQNTYLDHTPIQTENYSVGQIITVKFTIRYENTPTNLMQFDYEYNNKLLERVSYSFNVPGYQTSLNHWDGYKFSPNPNISDNNLGAQYSWYKNGNPAYYQHPDWSIERITIQGTQYIPTNTDVIFISFRIKDIQNTGYPNYLNATSLSWARYSSLLTGGTSGVFAQNKTISLNNVTGGNSGAVTLNLNANTNHPNHYRYTIEDTETQQQVASGYFDMNSQAIVENLTNDKTYHVNVSIDNNMAWYWLDDVITVSDAYLTFKQAIGAGNSPTDIGQNTFPYVIQQLYADVNSDGVVNFDDSYIMLNHIIGNNSNSWYTSLSNGGRSFWGRIEDYGTPGQYYYGQNYYFKPTFAEKQFTYFHGLIGDVDFSHSAVPVAPGSVTGTALNTKVTAQQAKSARVAANAEVSELVVSTSLVNGKVVLETTLNTPDIAGMEFIIQYDNEILTFDEVKFDTGSEITNFATPKGTKISFGSIDTTGNLSIKQGTPYKLIFTPNIKLTNTAGLVYFKLAEAIKKDGTKIILKIK